MSWWRSIPRKLGAWRALDSEDRRTLVRATFVLVEIWLRMRLGDFEAARSALEHRTGAGRPGPPPGAPPTDRQRRAARRIARLVRMAAHQVPWAAECLPRSLATRHLLLEAGIPADLRIGVRKQRGGELEAHAWVELGGRPVDDGDRRSPDRFAALEPAAGPRSTIR